MLPERGMSTLFKFSFDLYSCSIQNFLLVECLSLRVDLHLQVRLTNRRKKELKKRERKREADLRKKRNGNSEAENVVVVSNFGSLDI